MDNNTDSTGDGPIDSHVRVLAILSRFSSEMAQMKAMTEYMLLSGHATTRRIGTYAYESLGHHSAAV
jgi:hypothetical protein